ncbi:MAG: cupin domain-containing protein [Minicystis sp.]
MSTAGTNKVWGHHFATPGNPPGFSLRTAVQANPEGVETMLEIWEAGTSEPPHSHPGDDMTVVVEGRMEVQFFVRQGDALVKDGEPLVLRQGETGYVAAGRIHDARYLEPCKLVYVHDGAFGFAAQD